MHIFFRLIGPVAIGVLIKYQSEKGATYLQKITTPFTVFVLLFNLTVHVILELCAYNKDNSSAIERNSKYIITIFLGRNICILDLFCIDDKLNGRGRISYCLFWVRIRSIICLGVQVIENVLFHVYL